MRALVRVVALAYVASAVVSGTANAGPMLDEALQMHCGKTTCTIRNNPGGDVSVFQAAAQEVIDEGKRLVIDGFCASACVVLADLARSNTCITYDAQMAVHKASVIRITGKTIVDGREVPTGEVIRKKDPPDSSDISSWVYAHGGYPSEGVKIIPVQDARQFWPLCK